MTSPVPSQQLEYTVRSRLALTAATATACALVLSACGGSSSSPAAASAAATSAAAAATSAAPTSAAAGAGGVTGTIVVDAAASLTGTFTALGKSFEVAHPGTTVKLNFGGSDTLAAAITSGAPVDVFAAASTKTMAIVTAKGDGVGTPTPFAKNELEIAVPPSNPAKIASFADTVKSGVKLVTCAATVPCGAAATKAYAAAKLTFKPVSLEPDVKSVLTKVELNEADAGIVYKTDVLAAGSKVLGINFPEAAGAIATYPIVEVKGSKNAATAEAFIAYVVGSEGQTVLAAAGFEKP
ncbi:molybdate ABC transporter substrate-binding protein [Acidothermaceae bacterium B102]|nr:molybdate ABC transporter substrate-binding protein [Acidothermaceae bacterium B102]